MKLKLNKLRIGHFIEFFIIGLFLGIIEDIIAINLSTDAVITWETIRVVILVALPFAAFSELIVDRIKFSKKKRK